MLQANKKALSEIVSYAMLIVIALAMAAMVYSFLKIYIPKDTIECEDEIHLIVQNYSCSDTDKLDLIIANKGLFKVDAAYIRLGNTSQKIRTLLNKNPEIFGPNSLNPNNISANLNFDISSVSDSNKNYILEIQPAVKVKQRVIICEKARITQEISCS